MSINNMDNLTVIKFPSLPNQWEFYRLKNVCEILFSNVDKRIIEHEKKVLLCNYTDVYYNNHITDKITFMEGTSNEREIEKFSLYKNDVIITKDSETYNDIAVPSIVTENIENLICGYHLAILRPNIEKLDGLFLMFLLCLNKINHQFQKLANGITRFGLNLSSVEDAVIPVPPLPEQKKIAEILSTWDLAIEKTEKLIEEKTKLKKGLMQQLLTGKVRFREF